MFGNKMNAVEKAIKKSNANSLIGLANGNDLEVALAAVAGLGSIGGDDACNYLVAHVGSEAPEMRIAVAQALGKIGDMHTKAFVSAQIAKETNPEVREALTRVMSQIRSY